MFKRSPFLTTPLHLRFTDRNTSNSIPPLAEVMATSPRPPNSHPPVAAPTIQVEFTVSNSPEAAPHGLCNPEPTSKTCAWVAQGMNSETFLCKIADFLQDYGPVQVPGEDVLECKRYLVKANLLGYKQGAYVLWEHQTPPLTRRLDQNKVFEVALVIEAIFDYAKSVSKRGNEFTLVPTDQLTESVATTNHNLDVCIVEDKDFVGVSKTNNIVIGKEFKKHISWADQITVHEQLISESQYILNNDPRRMFIYGTTMEDRRMSVFYFSRSHSVESISFDWVSGDVDRFIEIYLAFAFATPAELGVDPLVHKAPIKPKSKDPSERVQQYVYECQPQADYANTTSKTRYYKIQHSLSPERPYRISGRMTRIWQVSEVDTINEAPKIPEAKPVILKDVWLDITRKTEAENMDLIFEAVDKFVADAHERYPGPHGLSQFMAEEPRFEHFDQQTKTRLEHLFTDQHYRSLFLTKGHAWKGEMTKKLSDNVKRPLDPIFIPLTTAKQNAGRLGEVPRTAFSGGTTSLQAKVSPEEQLAKKLVPTDLADRAFAQKQQSRFVYEEVCSRLWDLPTVGHLMNVLRQALDALQVLWCAGWAHRDISNGNILAFPDVEGNQIKWKVRLSDLEVAQPQCHRTQSSDSRVVREIILYTSRLPPTFTQGTPYFMPHEIFGRAYLFQSLRASRPPGDNFANQLNLPGGEANPNYQRFLNFHRFYGKTFTALPANATVDIPPRGAVVSYNFQHDLESVWWIALYFITAGVGHIPSSRYAAKIFTDGLTPMRDRAEAFRYNIGDPLMAVLLPSLQAAFVDTMDDLREELYTHYVARALFGQLDVPESYAQIHAIFATEFDRLLNANTRNWKQTKIVPLRTADDPRKRAVKDMPSLEDNPESTKRGRIGK
ncbi:hypothetical protein D9619_006112 [Psilocybe cf. subviscida]|uniref:Fungal-type protein kinase domain-containing protein n=1 Tax=Psilocybe cf. subviscida TaxID=2480587 RepID=A0A8H5B4T4_9AGAR|nr:hypothetical protein D9619_006112 [Psilocybe cf. subviscida]